MRRTTLNFDYGATAPRAIKIVARLFTTDSLMTEGVPPATPQPIMTVDRTGAERYAFLASPPSTERLASDRAVDLGGVDGRPRRRSESLLYRGVRSRKAGAGCVATNNRAGSVISDRIGGGAEGSAWDDRLDIRSLRDWNSSKATTSRVTGGITAFAEEVSRVSGAKRRTRRASQDLGTRRLEPRRQAAQGAPSLDVCGDKRAVVRV
jgi:hypothetical protein